MTHRASATRASSYLAIGAVGFIATASVPAHAQGEEPTRLEGMTVTDSAVNEGYRAEAQSSPKATATILDTPRIVNVITEEVLQDTASFSLEEAFRAIPGITLGAGEGGVASADIPFIRGIDATGDVFVDGARDVGSQTRETFALESLEVAKGPSSTFGGRGTGAGAINLVTKVAREGSFATAQVTAGTSDLIRVTGDVNSQIGEKLAVRMVGMFHDSEVAGRDHVADDRWGVLPSITWGVGTDISASLSWYHYETDGMPDYGIPLTSRFQLDPTRRDFRKPADTDRDNFYGLVNRDFQETKTDAVTFQFSGYLGGGLTLSNTTRYNYNTNDYVVTNPDDSAGNVANGLVWRAIKSRGSTSEGITSNTNLAAVFETGTIGHSLSTGFEMAVTDSENLGYSVDTGNRACPASELINFNCTTLANPDPTDPWAGTVTRSTGAPSVASAEEYSFYLFDTVTISPSLLLNGGVRWTKFSADGAGSGRGGPYAASNSGSFWTWQAGVIFKPTANTSIYASYADSKTPPGATVGEGAENIGAGDDLVTPQSYENFEIGAKAELLDGNLLLAAAAFRVNRDNVLLSVANTVDSYEEARLQGFEVSATGQVGPLSMVVGYTFVDSEIRDDAILHDGDPTNDGESAVGNTLPQSPRHSFAATAKWQVSEQFSVGGGAYAASKRYSDGGNETSSGGYVRFDANAEYQINDHFGVRLNVQNIGDERYITKLRNPHFAVPAAGRQGLITLTARY